MLLFKNFLYYYGLYTLVLFLCWVIGTATNVVLSEYSDHQQLKMPNLSSSLFITTTSGIGIVICGLFILALFHLLILKIILLCGLLVAILSAAILYQAKISWKTSLGIDKFNRKELIWLIPLFVYILGLLMLPLRPPSAHDELSYHLPYARFFLENKGLAVNEYLRFPLNALNFQLFYSLSLAISDAFLAHVFHAGCALLIALGIFGLCRSFYNYSTAYLAVVIFLNFNIIRNLMNTALIDLGLTLFVFSSVFNLMLWVRTDEKRWMILSAFFLGIGLGSKYSALVFIVPMELWILFHSRRIGPAVTYGLIALATGLPWYAWNFYISGNPVHPIASSLFGNYLWSADDVSRQIAEMGRHGIEKTFTNFLSLPYYATFTKSFGSKLPILALPFFASPFFYYFTDRAIKAPILIVWFYVVFWFFSSAQILRYLLPVFPMIAVIASVFITVMVFKFQNMIPKKIVNNHTKIIAGVIIFAIMTIYTGKITQKEIRKARHRPFEKTAIEKFLSKKNRGFELFQYVNNYQGLSGRPIYQLAFEGSIYFYKGRVMGDWFGPARYTNIWSQNPKILKQNLKKLGAEAIVINNERFGKYDRKKFSDSFVLLKENRFGAVYLIK